MKDNIDLKYEWTINTIPTHNNEVYKTVNLMNRYWGLPFPLSLISRFAKWKLLKKLNIRNLNFTHGFSIVYGNITGEDLHFQNLYILDYAPVKFGKNVNIGKDVKIITAWHPFENFSIVKASPITIGNNVWIAANSVILHGVEIGENSIIGAGSIVTKSIPPNVFAAGNPCKVIKYLKK